MNDTLFTKRYGKTYEDVKEVCESAVSMNEASKTLGVPYKTLARVAKKLGCFKSNQSGKGVSKPNVGGQYPLEDILNGKHPQYNSHRLKLRLYEAELKEAKCEECELTEWQGKPISLHLDHIDGNNSNHQLDNLRILCPNCHSQTPTYSMRKS